MDLNKIGLIEDIDIQIDLVKYEINLKSLSYQNVDSLKEVLIIFENVRKNTQKLIDEFGTLENLEKSILSLI